MNIVVLAGGLSAEREVSLSSGSMVCNALRRAGHRAALVDLFFGLELPERVGDIFTAEEQQTYRVKEQAPDLAAVKAGRRGGLGEIGQNVVEACRAADIVYLGLHGENGENGRIQAFLDMLGIPYTGSGYLGSALAMNKDVAKQALAQSGIQTPRGKAYRKGDDIRDASSFGFPCIVKPCSGGSSIGVAVARDGAELASALEAAFQYEDEALVEEYIGGREFSVGVLGDTALPAIEIIPNEGFYDYAHKYQPGRTREICPADVPPETEGRMRELATRAFRALRMEVYGRGEFILDANGTLYFLEMNTLPGMTPTSLIPQEAAAVGISYEELCERVVSLSLEKYK